MREIKFRAWHKKKKQFSPEHANFTFGENENYVVFDFFNGNFDTECWSFSECELMQFTGLQDKNGVDIYFDDVVYIAGYGDLHVNDLSDLVTLVDALAENDIGDILGNIHENPELIN